MAKMEKETPQEFELIPSIGHLLPGQRANIQVKFMPLDEVCCNLQTSLLSAPR